MGSALYTMPDGRKARITFDTRDQLDAAIADMDTRFVQPARPDAFAGDALLSDESMTRLASGERSTVTPSPQPSSPFRGVSRYLQGINEAAGAANSAPGYAPLGTLEALAALGTGAVAAPILGTAESIALGTPPDESFARYTYRPRIESGKAQLGLLGALASPLTESGADMALMPLAAQSQALSTVRRAPKEKPAPIPTTSELKKAKTEAYQAAKEVDVSVPAESYVQALGKVRAVAKEEGIDPTLHPKSTAVMRRLDEAEGKPLSLQESETLRKIALDAEDDLNPVTRGPTPDARIAGKIVDELDEHIEALGVNSPARALNARYRRSDMIDRMIRRAEIRAGAHYTQSGMEHALRQEFKTLAMNDRRMRFFTPEQRASIEKVAKGGKLENTLRNLGKFDPTSGGMSAFIGTGTGGAVGGAIGGIAGGGVGALALPALGFAAKRGATRMTGRNVDRAREALVGRGAPVVPSAEELGASLRDAGMVRPMTGEVMPRKPLALPSPAIIASTRSAPGTAYAREQMGLTPDVERAGALHPGMAREGLLSGAPALPYRAAPAAEHRPIFVDAEGRAATGREQFAGMSHPGAARTSPPRPALALPFREAKPQPMIVDSQGRVAALREQLQAYLRETGQERLRNVRQPRAEPMQRGLLAEEPAPEQRGLLGGAIRSAEAIRQDLRKLDAKLQRIPENEPLDSPKMKALEAEWGSLQAELAAAESRA